MDLAFLSVRKEEIIPQLQIHDTRLDLRLKEGHLRNRCKLLLQVSESST